MKNKRDQRFKKLCKWLEDAGEMAEIIREESSAIRRYEQAGFSATAETEERGIKNALVLLEFLSALYQYPQDYEDAPCEQKDLYPDCAFGLMFLALAVGQMKMNDDSPSPWGC